MLYKQIQLSRDKWLQTHPPTSIYYELWDNEHKSLAKSPQGSILSTEPSFNRGRLLAII